MEVYILKSAAILAIFFAFYKLFLENTSIHNFKRYYLFGSLVVSFLIPYITFTSYVEVSPVFYTYTAETSQIVFSETVESINYWPFALWTIYGLGVLFFGVKFFRNLFSLIQKIHKNPKYQNSGFINVLLSETVIPHTFFSYIFLNKKQFEHDEIPPEVLLHEQTHALQKHSLDVVFVELLQIVFWFNPLFYFIKRSIKLNHEFLADAAVLNSGAETSEYQKILLAFSSPDSYRDAFTPALAHSLNYSSIKKRFTVMKIHTSKRAIWFRTLLILPLFSVLVYGFSTKEIVQKSQESIEISKEKATKAEIAEYNKLAKKYNAMDIEKRIIKKNDLERLETIYRKMNLAQRAKAQPFPECNQTQNYSIAEDNKKFSEAIYYYKGKLITFEKANELIKKNNNIGIYIDKSGSEVGTIHLYEEPFDIKKIVIEKPIPTPTSAKNNGSTLSISRSDKTGLHFNTEPSKVTTMYYYEDNLIPLSKVHKLMNENKNLKVYITQESFGKSIVTLSEKPIVGFKETSEIPSAEKRNLYMAAEAPPAPNSNPVEYIKELAKKGATFYIGPHKYTPEEAIEMVEKSKNDVTIDVSKYPIVQLNGC